MLTSTQSIDTELRSYLASPPSGRVWCFAVREGESMEAAEELGVTMQMIGKLGARFVEHRLDGLLDEP